MWVFRSLLCATMMAFGITASAAQWQQASPALDPRFEGTIIEHDNKVYLLNGFTYGIKIQNSVEKYNPATDTWTRLKATSTSLDNPTAVTHNGVVVVGDEAWIIGGRIGNHPGRVTNRVWKYNLLTDTWLAAPDLPAAFAGGGAALVNERIHVFGGFDANARCDVDTHFVFDLKNSALGWQDITDVAAMPMPRGHFGTAVQDGLIYAIGGQNGHDTCPSLERSARNVTHVHAFDPATNHWTRVADLPFAESHIEPSTFTYQGDIYTLGGQSHGEKVLRYRPGVNQWEVLVDWQLPGPLLAPGALVIGEQLYVFGGGAPGIKNPSSLTQTFQLVDEPIEPVDDLISIKATDFSENVSRSNHDWAAWTTGMKTVPNTGSLHRSTQTSTSPELKYQVNFKAAGKYYLWVRGYGDSVNGEGKDDSLHVGLNDSVQAGADKIDGFGPAWEWRKTTRDKHFASINVPSAGVHTLNVWMREDGLAIEQLLLTTNADYHPDESDNGEASTSTDTGSDNTPPGGTATEQVDTVQQLSVSMMDVDFGTVLQGDSVSRQLTLSNTGNTSIDIQQWLVQGTAASSYELISQVPTILAENQSVTLTLRFTPSSVGEHAAVFSLLHDPDSTLTLVALEGNAVPAEATDDPPIVDNPDTGTDTASPTATSSYHINVGGPDLLGTQGVFWSSDRGEGLENLLVSPTGFYQTFNSISVSPQLEASGAVEALFKTERYSTNRSDMRWEFPVTAGDYLVNLFFAEIYSGTSKPNARLFDIAIEGNTQLHSLDVFAEVGAHTAMVKTFQVNSDDMLSVTLTKQLENPALKAISILPCPAACSGVVQSNTAPSVQAGPDSSIVLGEVLMLDGQVQDDGLPNAELFSTWSMHNGPADITLGEPGNSTTSATFSQAGEYTIRLTVTDNELTSYDDIAVVVSDPQQPQTHTYTESDGQVLLEAESFTAHTPSASHSWILHPDAGASQGQSMKSGPDIGVLKTGINGSPMLSYRVYFDKPGTRYVWIRGSGDTNANGEGKSDSLHVGLNGAISPTADKIDQFPAAWSWTNHTRDRVAASISVPSAGVHTVNVWMREDGLLVDQILLTDSNSPPAL